MAIFVHGIDSPVNKLQSKIVHILSRAKTHGNIVEKISYGLDKENIEYITVQFKSSIFFPKLSEKNGILSMKKLSRVYIIAIIQNMARIL